MAPTNDCLLLASHPSATVKTVRPGVELDASTCSRTARTPGLVIRIIGLRNGLCTSKSAGFTHTGTLPRDLDCDTATTKPARQVLKWVSIQINDLVTVGAPTGVDQLHGHKLLTKPDGYELVSPVLT